MNRSAIRKILSLLLIVATVVILAACNQVPPESTENSTPHTNTSEFVESTGTSASDSFDEKTDSVSNSSTSDVVTDNTTDSATSDTVTTTTETDDKTESKIDTSTSTKTDSDTSDDTTNSVTDTSSEIETQTSTTTDSASDKTTDVSQSESSKAPEETDSEDSQENPVNTNISPIAPENYFGIRWLSTQPNGENLVKTYGELVSGVKELQQEIPLTAGISEQELDTVWYCFQSDFPQYFWLGNRYEYYHSDGKATKIAPAYSITKEDLPRAQKAFDNAVTKLLTGIVPSMTQYEIEETLHNRLVVHCNYQENEHSHSAYGALVNGTAVCDGITKAFQHLCRSVGIETLFVFGKSNNPVSGDLEGHSWNIVKINKCYYHVDVTWDNAGEPQQDEMHYAWFNLPTQWITEDHVLEQLGYPYPECNETAENYFTKHNDRLSALSVEAILKRTIKHGDEYFFRAYLTNETDPNQWIKQNAPALAEKLGLNGYTYRIITVGHEVTIVMSDYKE